MLAHLLWSLPSGVLPCFSAGGRGLHEIQSTKDYVRIYKLFMQNKPNVKQAKINLISFMTSIYIYLDIWLFGKNKAKQTQYFYEGVIC